MPAIMIRPVAGSKPVANGSRIEIVAGGPRPGRMPTSVPSRQPTRSHSRFVGAIAASRAESRRSNAFTGGLQLVSVDRADLWPSSPQGSFGELDLEQGGEQQVHR